MNHSRFLFILALPLLWSCSNMDYDISEGFSKEITLFEDEITVPIGRIGPLTVGSTLGGLSKMEDLGGLLGDYIKVGSAGDLILDDSGDIFKANIYELEQELGDVSSAKTWDAGYQSGYPGGLAAALGYIGLKTVNQKVEISVSNPLKVAVPAHCEAMLNCIGTEYVALPVPELDNFTIKARADKVVLATLEIPASVTFPLSAIIFSSLSLDLPADPVSKIYDSTGNLFFAFSYYYTCGIAVGETFSLPLNDFSAGDISLPIGKYKLKKCEISVDVESTIPLAVSINNIRVLKQKASETDPDTVDENIQITSDIKVAGGSIDKPAVTPVKLTIEALEGTVPDINGMLLDFVVSSQPGIGDIALTADQGIVVKSSSAKLSGGITIPEN